MRGNGAAQLAPFLIDKLIRNLGSAGFLIMWRSLPGDCLDWEPFDFGTETIGADDRTLEFFPSGWYYQSLLDLSAVRFFVDILSATEECRSKADREKALKPLKKDSSACWRCKTSCPPACVP